MELTMKHPSYRGPKGMAMPYLELAVAGLQNDVFPFYKKMKMKMKLKMKNETILMA